ncbi:cytidine deaminase [Candidatus Arthromitus sp. SFB-rat-Yit]|uniref:cytidine deaminase n=1 Tax=Candidatus Arthromitus sp. SFB-rat-Yit TaxID=1041504 RepID=UPI000227A551|nr:cytidine deaminase [Candidatus Arthromitus sp. SFB-rat-Yit]BAK80997.1 cytidine deaminase [Candidatus Arthromitus sp. SFB-rat-Yit]
MDKVLIQDLIGKSLEVREKAYVPYSKFPVGSSVLFENSKIFTGCNVENASFGASNCAERTAIFKAVSEGYRKIYALCVVGSLNDFTYPCGICRQVLSEFVFDMNIPVIIAKNKEEYRVHKLSEILPYDFGVKNLI